MQMTEIDFDIDAQQSVVPNIKVNQSNSCIQLKLKCF